MGMKTKDIRARMRRQEHRGRTESSIGAGTFAMLRIDRRYAWTLVRTTLVAWFGVRIALALVGALGHLEAVTLSPLQSAIVLAATVGLVLLDAHVMRDTLFHANLGTSRVWVVLCAAVPAVALEAAAALVAHAVRG